MNADRRGWVAVPKTRLLSDSRTEDRQDPQGSCAVGQFLEFAAGQLGETTAATGAKSKHSL